MTSRPVCSLTSDPGYVIYSACGSFWVPMLGMVVFYWKIYKTAVAATEAYKRGFVEPKTSGLSSSTSENALCNPLSRADADYFARLRRFSVRGSSSAVASRTDSDVSDERGGFPGCRGAGFPEENALCMLRIHRGGSSGSMLQRHSNGCLSELPRHRINQLCVEWDVKP